MEKKQTAIDWLFDKITQNGEIRWRGTQYRELFEQAKEMEKDQIMRAYKHGEIGEIYELNPIKTLTAKQYYENTYEKE